MDQMVKITYKNRKLEEVRNCEYSLKDYTSMIRLDLMRQIGDIEELGYRLSGGKGKEDWDDESLAAFEKIKHRILDKAGEIDRLPENIRDVGGEPASIGKFIHDIFEKD